MKKALQFGEHVEGYTIPVLNEREVRAAAGLLFLGVFTSVMLIFLKLDFTMMKFAVTLFLVDFIIRVFISPRYAPTLILGRLIVRNQTPEYVGAQQKKFAWVIGVVLAAIMFVHMVLMNAYSPITGIACMICLVFLFFEASFGICLGCKVYPWIYKEKAQYCPGEVCDVKSRHEIQKTSAVQALILAGFIVATVVSVQLLHDQYAKMPYDLFGINNPAPTSGAAE